MQTHATSKYFRAGPRKVRRFSRLIKGKSAEEAEAILLVHPSPTCKMILKVLRSAVANGENNSGLDKDNLFVKNVFVDEGPMLKRFRPRARGRASPILKRMSHVKILLDEVVPTEVKIEGEGE